LRERFAAALASLPSGDERPPANALRGEIRVASRDAFDFLKDQPGDWSDWKLVANLPYSVASPILVELAAGIRAPKMMVVTLQLEVARRLMAKPTMTITAS
jgi:16S rRNA A1518/A1519 N6-dimethyltransferase RsmA/KsgA/DIM1 with predicted DNA glycosylase/AP lyase activity